MLVVREWVAPHGRKCGHDKYLSLAAGVIVDLTSHSMTSIVFDTVICSFLEEISALSSSGKIFGRCLGRWAHSLDLELRTLILIF